MTPIEGKDTDSNDSRKIFIILLFLLVLQFLLDFLSFFLFSFFHPSVVVVDFISTMESN